MIRKNSKWGEIICTRVCLFKKKKNERNRNFMYVFRIKVYAKRLWSGSGLEKMKQVQYYIAV